MDFRCMGLATVISDPSSVSLDDPSDLKTAARLFKLEIPVQVTGDELLLSHFSVARTVDSMPEQAVLGFRTGVAWSSRPLPWSACILRQAGWTSLPGSHLLHMPPLIGYLPNLCLHP